MAVILNVTAMQHFSTESDFDLAVRLTKDYGITTIPVSSFYTNKIDNKVLRFALPKKRKHWRRLLKS